MHRVRFGVEFQTLPPHHANHHRFLLVGDEIRFVDPAVLVGVAYEAHLGTVAAAFARAIADGAHSQFDERDFRVYTVLLDRRIERYNNAVQASWAIALLTVILFILTFGIFNYRGSRTVALIERQPDLRFARPQASGSYYPSNWTPTPAFPTRYSQPGSGFRNNSHIPVVTGNLPYSPIGNNSGFRAPASTPTVTGRDGNVPPSGQGSGFRNPAPPPHVTGSFSGRSLPTHLVTAENRYRN